MATANFNVLDKDKDLNKDYRKLTSGLKILKGNRWASFFGASNYQKLTRSYRRQFVQKRSDGKGGVILFDTRTGQPTTDALINEAIVKNVTGSSNPNADLKYINARGRAEIKKNLGNLKDGVSFNDILYNTRRLFSDPLYNTKGERIGKEIDLKRDTTADKLRIQAGEASLGTRYDEFLDPASPVYKGSTEVGTMVNGQLQSGSSSNQATNLGSLTISADVNPSDQVNSIIQGAQPLSAKENVSTDEKDPAEVIEKNQEIKGAIKEPGSEKNKEKIQISDDSKNFIPTVMDIENDARTFGESEKGMQRKLKMMIDKQKADALKQAQQALKNAAKVA